MIPMVIIAKCYYDDLSFFFRWKNIPLNEKCVVKSDIQILY